ncbi:MAG: thrombospondin type 3 repeat-containing protein [Bradymonadia bacterium]
MSHQNILVSLPDDYSTNLLEDKCGERAGMTDVCASEGGDSDGDGICDDVDQCNGGPLSAFDLDFDGDGVPSSCDLCDTDPNIGAVGDPSNPASLDYDGDGNSGFCDADSDNDHCYDYEDYEPFNDTKFFGIDECDGSEIYLWAGGNVDDDIDANGKEILNCADDDSDNDGLPDYPGLIEVEPGRFEILSDPCPLIPGELCRIACSNISERRFFCSAATCGLHRFEITSDALNGPTIPLSDVQTVVNDIVYVRPSDTIATVSHRALISQIESSFPVDSNLVVSAIRVSDNEVVKSWNTKVSHFKQSSITTYGVLYGIPMVSSAFPSGDHTFFTFQHTSWEGPDVDGDGVLDHLDNCVQAYNPSQADTDRDSYGNACDYDYNQDGVIGTDDLALLEACIEQGIQSQNNPHIFDSSIIPCNDTDMNMDGLITNDYELEEFLKVDFGSVPGPSFINDRYPNLACPPNPGNDEDLDGVCLVHDNCPSIANSDQMDDDEDLTGNACDICPLDAANDVDGDGICGDVDNCPTLANHNQEDNNNDGFGDACLPLNATISDCAIIDHGAIIGENAVINCAHIHSGAVIGEGAVIGQGNSWPRVEVRSGANIGAQVIIGERNDIGENVTIGPDATLGQNVILAANATVGANVTLTSYNTVGEGSEVYANMGSSSRIGTHSIIEAGATINSHVVMDDDVVISNGAVIESHVDISNRSIVGAGATLGSQTEVGEDVSIGENSQITARLKNGVTIGNDCNIRSDVGEGISIGNNTIIKPRVGYSGDGWPIISGSVTIGDDVYIGDSTELPRDIRISSGVTIMSHVTIRDSDDPGASVVIHADTVINYTAVIGENVFVGPGAYIEDAAHIDDDTMLASNVRVQPRAYVGKRCLFGDSVLVGSRSTVGDESILDDEVVIFPDTTVGERVELGNGVRVGEGVNWHGETIIGDYTTVAPGINVHYKAQVGSCLYIDADVPIRGVVPGNSDCVPAQ